MTAAWGLSCKAWLKLDKDMLWARRSVGAMRTLPVPSMHGAAAATPCGQPSGTPSTQGSLRPKSSKSVPLPYSSRWQTRARPTPGKPPNRWGEPNAQAHAQPLRTPPTLLQGRQLLLEPVHILLQVVHAVDQAWAGWEKVTVWLEGGGRGYASGVSDTVFMERGRHQRSLKTVLY